MMRSSLVLGALGAAVLLSAGCNLYFGGDDQPPNCGDVKEIPAFDLRDPQTGECESLGWGQCSPECPCPEVAMPDWASCGGACDALDEQSCLATPGCHAQYTGTACPPNADCTSLQAGITFWTCSAVAPSGPIEGGDCWSLDAQSCAEHDDCATTYQIPEDPPDTHHFNQCIQEPVNTGGQCTSDLDCPGGDTCDLSICYPPPGCDPSTGACSTVCYGVCKPKQDVCAGVDCGPGAHCEQQCAVCDPPGTNGCMQDCAAVCVPDQQDCSTVDCAPGTHCEVLCTDPPTCDPNSGVICPPPTCGPQCLPDNPDPGDCYGQVTCGSAPPACPAGTTPGTANGCWTGFCIPITECKHDPGSCDGPVLCNSAPPACPMGTVPGIANGCWSGYCIPTWACPQPTCESITDEKSCLARGDCTAIYDGQGCTCDPSGVCTCTSETFARCQTAGMTPGK